MRSNMYLFISAICGYLFISWLPLPKPIEFSNIILQFVFNPVKFFAATTAFFVGFISNGIFIREIILMSIKVNKSKGILLMNVVLYFSMLIILFQFGFWHMVIFFSFAFLYGMMTIEKSKTVL